MLRRTAPGIIPWLVVMLVVLAGFLISSCLHRRQPDRPNVLWITIDSLRYDHLGCFGYHRAHTPNIDALAQQGAAFSQAISQASSTRYSVPSMVTGRYPLFVPAQTFASGPKAGFKTVAEILTDIGYRTLVITQEPPVKAVARGFEKVLDTASDTEVRTQVCLKALHSLAKDRFFIWLYYWDPHIPYRPPDRFLRLFEPESVWSTTDPRPQTVPGAKVDPRLRDQAGRLRGELVVMGKINFEGDIVPSEEDRQHLANLYDAEIALVDNEIGKLIEQLKDLKLWDQTLILITADHGEAFGEHGKYYHGLNLYEEVVRVPLVIKPAPALSQSRTIACAVRNVDIMPTILDYCAASAPNQLDGASLRSWIEGKACQDLPTYLETYYRKRGAQDHLLVGYRHWNHKLIYDLFSETAALYDLEQDPEEQTDLLQAPEDVSPEASVLEGQLKQALLSDAGVSDLQQLAHMKLEEKMDGETEKRLRALGYVQ